MEEASTGKTATDEETKVAGQAKKVAEGKEEEAKKGE